ncbi:MAG: tRNA 2-selenouridine(34) synthase MnmH, partial [Betaproteobacteria bacterium]|nr:tRNA 2-selenouridine(34) synthase MnmH [Betaproteobacteria bacterium]
YRREIVAQLEQLPRQFEFLVVCGATGSGKSRLLEALAARGAQVLDLERLACHRGSVLGDLPEEPQPAQKMLDSLVWNTLKHFSPARPVIVEAESRKIGRLQVTDALLEKMRNGRCLRIEAPLPERVRFLIEEYRHFLDDPAALKDKLSCLAGLYGKEVIGRWLAQADARRWHELVADLLVQHYDPAYRRSTLANYRRVAQAAELHLGSLSPESIGNAADKLLREGSCV